jgi:hypothetical protein
MQHYLIIPTEQAQPRAEKAVGEPRSSKQQIKKKGGKT